LRTSFDGPFGCTTKMGLETAEERAENLFRTLDDDPDGEIDEEEFIKLSFVVNILLLFSLFRGCLEDEGLMRVLSED